MNALKANKFKVGDEVEIVKLDKTMQRFGGTGGALSPIGTKTYITYVDVTGKEIEIDKDIYTYHADDLVLVDGKEETQVYNPLKENKFRVGDYVEIINHKNTVDRFGGNTIGFPQIGLVGVVNNVTDHCVGIVGHMYLMDASDVGLLETSDQRTEESQTYNPLIAQEGGGHYKNRGIQPLEYTMKNNLSFCEGNVVKYISRYKSKNGIEDLAKVIHYALLASYEEYGEQGSTELKEKVLKLLGEHG